MTTFGKRVFKEVIKLNEVIRLGPNQIYLVFLQEKISTQIHTEERSYEDTRQKPDEEKPRRETLEEINPVTP